MSRPQSRLDAAEVAKARGGESRLTVRYEHAPLDALLAAPDTLAVIGFGGAPPAHADPRYLRVELPPVDAPAPFEVWRARGAVVCGGDGALRYAHTDALLFGAIELEEAADDIEGAAQAVYARIDAFLGAGHHPHLLRLWNYLDAITEGEGDNERYRRFSVGRSRGLGALDRYPAATAIGRRVGLGRAMLQVYFLAARVPGYAIENPRQVSAYRYPRQYGPQPPSFARGMVAQGLPLMISGTASVVGHATAHAGRVEAQLDETLANLDSLLAVARGHDAALSPTFGARSVLKVYVRDAADAPRARARLAERLPGVEPLLLVADICRRDLLIEVDGFHG